MTDKPVVGRGLGLGSYSAALIAFALGGGGGCGLHHAAQPAVFQLRVVIRAVPDVIGAHDRLLASGSNPRPFWPEDSHQRWAPFTALTDVR